MNLWNWQRSKSTPLSPLQLLYEFQANSHEQNPQDDLNILTNDGPKNKSTPIWK